MSIYRTQEGRRQVLRLYDAQLQALGTPFEDRWVETSFARTHLVEVGAKENPPIFVLHGGNATTACNLLNCRFLLPWFHIYAADLPGHPGKSGEQCLPPYGRAYGKWAAEVIAALGYERLRCFGGSFGAGVLVKLMAAAPEKVERAVLTVPAALKNALPLKTLRMLGPLMRYRMTGEERWCERCFLPLSAGEQIPPWLLAAGKCSLDHVKIKAMMPCDEPGRALRAYHGPVYVLAAQKDCLFPAKGVLRRAARVWPQCRCGLLAGRGHIHSLTEEEEQGILEFLR